MSNHLDSETLSPAVLAGVTPMMLVVGVQVALRVGASVVVSGLTRTAPGEHLGLPQANPQTDNRREMLHGMNVAYDALLSQKTRITIETPLIDLSYPEIVQLAARFDLPLGECWTCCSSSATACGACEPCVARGKAFAHARTVDPATTDLPLS